MPSRARTMSTISIGPSHQEDPTVRLLDIQSQGTSRGTSNTRSRNSLDDLASAILEDTTMTSALESPVDRGPRVVSDETPCTVTRVYPHPIQNIAIVEDDGVEEAPAANRKIRQRPAPVVRPSPSLPRRSSRRRSTRQRQSPPAPPRGDYVKGLPKSSTGALNPLAMHPPNSRMTKLPASATMPLTTLHGQSNASPTTSNKPVSFDPAEIADKIEKMLAATQALKSEPQPAQPTTAIPSSSTSSKVSRLVKKNGLFKKVSHALSERRLFPKNQSKESKVQNTVEEEDETELVAPQDVAGKRTGLKSIELRLNEGVNLNKDKVQKIFGGKVRRKPVPMNGKTLRTRRSLDDPFSSPSSLRRHVTEFETRLRGDSVDDSVLPPLSSENPFESERVMEGSLDSILPSAPIASSTPRRGYKRTSSPSESPTKKPRGGLRSRSIDFNTILPMGLCSESAQPKKNPLALSSGLANMFSYVPVVDDFERKKHPSPAKGDLELMTMEFRTQYPDVLLGRAAVKQDEQDELARSTLHLPGYDADRENKYLRPPCASRSASNRSGESTEDDEAMVPLLRPSRSRQLHGVPRKAVIKPAGIARSRTDSQLTCNPYVRHMETDELQRDSPATKHGYRPLGSQEVF
ncbi:hypothetical protein SMACR_02702 [Sordaria macrospora]|uniref:WGS project CABT00000000 data, contig 2.11 n=3 Tax=Sordaria macrospora TaxID=5147 RepID=F7VX81_SORMK|nr:uncharacterized protein SMAC_02702 [Sordaria macrospora k-hell]KAA8636360.1 hypothetical protein SMACR_02702 [Sordaria macrospora]KAH7633086.1 hypothetical protein B0T09DRAFT_279994 [Sordaria sp. MPI-SDFR-AT-0083]CCC10123.1 unnamed protein product [Sordaria macrospora k-hell]